MNNKSIFPVILFFLVVGGCGSGGGSGPTIIQEPTPPINSGDVLIAGLFKDANLQACADKAAADQFLTNAKANQITGIFRCNDTAISDLTGINNLVNITGLALSGDGLSNIVPLQGMTKLLSLTLTANNISDISVVSTLPNLYLLNLAQNQITDINPLKDLVELSILDLHINNIEDVSALSGLIKLVDLNLGDNSIIDVAPLSSLTSLTGLSLQANNIGGMGVGNVIDLVALTKLDSLRIFSNIGMSCTGLQTLLTTFTGITTLLPATAIDGTDCTSP